MKRTWAYIYNPETTSYAPVTHHIYTTGSLPITFVPCISDLAEQIDNPLQQRQSQNVSTAT